MRLHAELGAPDLMVIAHVFADEWVDGEDGPDRGTCPYYQRAMGGDPEGICSFGCVDEPMCVTCEPHNGWPSARGEILVETPAARPVHETVRSIV